jgi:hypothetical protein
MTREESQLAEIVARIIEARRDYVVINPNWIATEALKEIDPSSRSVALVRLGCHLQLRQIARQQCRKLFEDSEEDDEPRFAGFEGLQWRYPTAHSKRESEPEYILRDRMSGADVAYNVARLRSESRAKAAHADLLEAWDRSRPKAA